MNLEFIVFVLLVALIVRVSYVLGNMANLKSQDTLRAEVITWLANEGFVDFDHDPQTGELRLYRLEEQDGSNDEGKKED